MTDALILLAALALVFIICARISLARYQSDNEDWQ